MSFVVVIPARYASTRFPGKPLADLGGRPMVVRVCERAAASGAASVHVATDDARIADAVQSHGFRALMTRADHASGTDRIAEAAAQLGLADDAIVVNVQGDEPLIAPALIAQVAETLAGRPQAAVSTPVIRSTTPPRRSIPTSSRWCSTHAGDALYFSRAPIPWARDAYAEGGRTPPAGLPLYRHAGIYGYRVAFLRRYAALAASPLEAFEALEQLRVLWHGERIAVAVSAAEIPPGVDTPADLELVRARFDRAPETG